MTDRVREAVVNRTSGLVNRRTSLVAIGLAALGAMGGAAPAAAGNGGKKARKVCGRQRGPCEAFVRESCDDDDACIAARTRCCGLLANCQFTAFVACFDEAQQNDQPRTDGRAKDLLG